MRCLAERFCSSEPMCTVGDAFSKENIFDCEIDGASITQMNQPHVSTAGFITDGNSKLVGNARIRQLRVQRNSCQVAGSMQQLVPGCHAPYSWEVEDTGSYGPGWNCSTRNHTTSTPNPWKYQTQAELRANPVWGNVTVYGGGGFAAELGPDLQNASK